jgi:hypothetical protein
VITTILSGFGTLFFSAMFVLGLVISWRNPITNNIDVGRNIFICLIGAVLCAWIGGW